MKRDMNLIRNILLEMENRSRREMGVEMIFEGHSEESVMYHVELLREARLIVAVDVTEFDRGYNCYEPVRLTWDGHEFLDAARSDTIWAKVTGAVREKAGAVSFEVLKQLLCQFAMSQVGY